jgi:SAM-dependent methyltransferase
MLGHLPALLPSTIKRVARALFTKPGPPEPSEKHDWEFWWQQTQWLDLWKKPRVKAKCFEYWKSFRHLDDIRASVPIDEKTCILDVGCGLASVLHYLPGRRIGVDPLGERYKTIYDYPFEVIGAPGEALPFPDSSFDVVFCSNCIDHTTDPEKVIEEIRRILRSSGHFILTCEVFASNEGVRNVGHPYSFTAERFLALPAGFERLAHWVSPWYGMRNYVVGKAPTTQEEHIQLLKKPDHS